MHPFSTSTSNKEESYEDGATNLVEPPEGEKKGDEFIDPIESKVDKNEWEKWYNARFVVYFYIILQ